MLHRLDQVKRGQIILDQLVTALAFESPHLLGEDSQVHLNTHGPGAKHASLAGTIADHAGLQGLGATHASSTNTPAERVSLQGTGAEHDRRGAGIMQAAAQGVSASHTGMHGLAAEPIHVQGSGAAQAGSLGAFQVGSGQPHKGLPGAAPMASALQCSSPPGASQGLPYSGIQGIHVASGVPIAGSVASAQGSGNAVGPLQVVSGAQAPVHAVGQGAYMSDMSGSIPLSLNLPSCVGALPPDSVASGTSGAQGEFPLGAALGTGLTAQAPVRLAGQGIGQSQPGVPDPPSSSIQRVMGPLCLAVT